MTTKSNTQKKTAANTGQSATAKQKAVENKKNQPALAKPEATKAESRTEKKGGKNVFRFPAPFPESARIKVLADKNPKRPGTKGAARFEMYRNGMTVKKALEKGILPKDLVWDKDHKFIEIQTQ